MLRCCVPGVAGQVATGNNRVDARACNAALTHCMDKRNVAASHSHAVEVGEC
jgi:hypothetical protein